MAINLLPDTAKHLLKLIITQKKLVVVLVFICLSFLCFLSLLFLLNNFLAREIEQTESLVREAETKLEHAAFRDFKATVTKTNQQIARVRQLWQGQLKLASLLEDLAQRAPGPLYFTNLSLQKEGGEIKVNLAGFAEDRESLFYFKQNLEEDGLFDNVYFAPSSWVRPSDINFSLTFDFKPET